MSATPRPPITVRRVIVGRRVKWRWRCADHPHHRGDHHARRFVDQWRYRRGLPPDEHPFARAMRGADQHWHRHHSPPHDCCQLHPKSGD